jgi:hypothetical protein
MGGEGVADILKLLIVTLALLQAALGISRAFEWFQFGTDLAGRGILLLPILGAIAVARGVLIGAIALLYALFAWGLLAERSWASWVAIGAILLNGLAVSSVVLRGEPLLHALLWAIVPAVIAGYLLATAGRHPLIALRAKGS